MFTDVLVVSVAKTVETSFPYAQTAAALAAAAISIYAAKKSKKQMRKLKRKLMLSYAKQNFHVAWQKFKNLFSKKKAPVSDRTLLYIILGAIVLALIFINPIVALAVLVVGLLIILLMRGGLTASARK
ncbi:MAG: hypothetical protein C4308_11730 [Chitinophagaceae bacterium]